jgi:hypothetical protein
MVNKRNRDICLAHLKKLAHIVNNTSADDERRFDAINTLAMMALLFTAKDDPMHPGCMVQEIEAAMSAIGDSTLMSAAPASESKN